MKSSALSCQITHSLALILLQVTDIVHTTSEMQSIVVILAFLALSIQGSSGQIQCQFDPTSTPFHEARTHLGSIGNVITGTQMERLADELFNRFDCKGRGDFCNCFPQGDMRRLLEMEDNANFEEEHFDKACVMLIETARDLEGYCPRIKNDSGLTYGTFEHFLTECPGCHEPHSVAASLVETDDEHGHQHGFSWTLLDQYSHVLNHTYLPEDCSNTFSAETVFRSLPLKDPGHGEIDESEVPIMSSALVMRFVKGNCLLHSHWHVQKEDFLMSLFHHYANETTCLIYEDGFDQLLHNLVVAEHSDEVDDDEDDNGHHPHSATTSSHLYNLWGWLSGDVSAKEDDDAEHDHEHGDPEGVPINASMNCYTTDILLEAFHIDLHAGMDQDQMKEISYALTQQVAIGCQIAVEEATPSSDQLTTAQIYGYATLAVFVESLCALIGLVIIKWRNTDAYKYILVVMLGLSVGTMCGDAILHLIPKVLGLHSHAPGEHNHSHDGIVVEDYTWKMFVMMCAVWAFFMFQLGMEAVAAKRARKSGDKVMEMQYTAKEDEVGIENYSFKGDMGESYSFKGDMGENGKVDIEKSETKVANGTSNGTSNGTPNGTPNGTTNGVANGAVQKKGGHGHSHFGMDSDESQVPQASGALPLMVLAGDGLHNFADGMAIGAAFVAGWRTGLSTTIAVFCHELPHEFGDIAAVLSAGWSPLRAAMVNGAAALCAFVGLYIGIPVSTALDADAWILAVAAGMFIYISLADIIPELVEFFRMHNKLYMFIAANSGFALGFLIMMLIAIFEDEIAV